MNSAEIHRIADGKVSLFSRGKTYYARFKVSDKSLSGGKAYITETLRTDHYDRAIDLALTRYAEITLLQRQGRVIKSKSVAAELQKFVEEYEEGLKQGLSGFSVHMFRGFKGQMARYFQQYFSNKALEEISAAHLDNYESWRLKYWERHTSDHGNIKQRASKRTIAYEIGLFKQFLRWAKRRGLYSGTALDYRFDAGQKNSRSAFTQAQWQKLLGFMRRKAWREVGKHGKDSRLLRGREMLHAYILFMANTGIRVGEARNLRWSSLTFKKGKTEAENQLIVRVSASHSKVGKKRDVVGTEGAYNVMEMYLQMRKQATDFAKPEDFIWCTQDGKVIRSFRTSFNALLENAGVRKDEEGQNLTVYSLRHTYITLRKQAGVDVYSLAKNAGTSVQMIEQFYGHTQNQDFATELTKGYRKRAR